MRKPVISKYGQQAILIQWESIISPEINQLVVDTSNYLNEHFGSAILEIVPSYQSLVIYLNEGFAPTSLITELENTNWSIDSSLKTSSIWRIPVCYDASFGLDLESISQTRELSIESIIKLHTEPDYRIYGIGFLPGFLYLGGLNEQLFSPRRRVVKRFAPKGSVAIGGQQTGIYPQESPGGWNIIGRTPIELFDTKVNPPTPFSIGDSVRFFEINRHEYAEIEQEVKLSAYNLTSISND